MEERAGPVVFFSVVEDGKAVKLALRILKIPFLGGGASLELDSAEEGLDSGGDDGVITDDALAPPSLVLAVGFSLLSTPPEVETEPAPFTTFFRMFSA